MLGDGENVFIDLIRSTKNIAVTVRTPLSFYLVKLFYFISDFVNPHSSLDKTPFVSDTISFFFRERSNAEFAFTLQGIFLAIIFYIIALKITR